jgi:hypothetical protein
MSAPVPSRRPSALKLGFWLLVVPALLIALYFFAVMKWNYSTGERAGWVQKFSKKGWFCKTWEGELSMVSMPGAAPEKFFFTVWDEKIAAEINGAMGRRVSLHYEEKVGLPTTCFGETRHWVNGITIVPEIPLAPGITVPTPAPAGSGSSSAGAPLPTPPASGPSMAPAPGIGAPSTPPPAAAPAPPQPAPAK